MIDEWGEKKRQDSKDEVGMARCLLRKEETFSATFLRSLGILPIFSFFFFEVGGFTLLWQH